MWGEIFPLPLKFVLNKKQIDVWEPSNPLQVRTEIGEQLLWKYEETRDFGFFLWSELSTHSKILQV